ncbi:uroporphyrinogen-III synthase [Steroidobacter denitrificans]|uniref:Uroporphyrinogen-III synthase n=1 Tax=Steroidobacter denitrificans TaxID=465721 RepID=A0A127FEJ5_STEDE|nr:uroporphyrinogen-III synthase [Steroidobacter denitrificans]AMN48335.1 uroporphyrinogen-III synthase [Steroidobacter denitrificans]
MIPKVLPPLTALSVLVTRPEPQCLGLCEQIERYGGTAVPFPALRIEALQAAPAADHDLIVFLSVNAVVHGAHLVKKAPGTRIAAIGKATAASLAQVRMPVDIVPETGFTSEDLLAHPQLAAPAGTRVLIVQGIGGRGVLHERFRAQGMMVESLEVYRRVLPEIDEHERTRIEAHWQNDGIDVVTLTSVEILHNLLQILTPRGQELLRRTALLTVSRRIAQAAAHAGLHGPVLHAGSADDATMIGTLAQWRTRARIG